MGLEDKNKIQHKHTYVLEERRIVNERKSMGKAGKSCGCKCSESSRQTITTHRQ